MGSTVKQICVVRWHDGTAKSNWGGRATTLGIGRIIHRMPGHTISAVVNGVTLLQGFDQRPLRTTATVVSKIRRRITGQRRLAVRSEDFGKIQRRADNLLSPAHRRHVADLVATLERCEEVWVNGEGDFIFTARPSLYRCLVIMHMAMRIGKPVRLINSILSDPPSARRDAHVFAAVTRTLRQCASVTYRDPNSLRIHEESIADLKASWCPDALFSWAGERLTAQPFGPGYEGVPPTSQPALTDGPYVAISGSSGQRGSRAAACRDLQNLVGGIERMGMRAIVVATDRGDHWMTTMAEQEGWPYVPARVPLATGSTILYNAAALISGRYHPSILASLYGTPCALMPSNSHKTDSLQEVLGYAISAPGFGTGEQCVDAVSQCLEQDRGAIVRRAETLSKSINWCPVAEVSARG